MREHLPETHREAKTKCNDYCRVILSLQLSIAKYRANSPKAPSRHPVFHGLPNVEYDTDHWTLIDRRNESELEVAKLGNVNWHPLRQPSTWTNTR
jgi:hypothetical protein